MVVKDDNPECKAVLFYDEKYDEKGRLFWKPTYLKETPSEEIIRLNKLFPIK
jgi:hypothetical protein